MDITKRLEEVLHELNQEYGQDRPLRIYEKTLDYDEFHFEFEDIFGFAAYKRTDGKYNFVLISEDDDFWHINKNLVVADAFWIESIENASRRMNHWIKLKKAYKS